MNRKFIPAKTVFAVDSAGLLIIRIDQYTSNLALTTSVQINTETDEVKVVYKVQPYSDNEVFKHITKHFDKYQEAADYYNNIVEKYPNIINAKAAEIWWKQNSFFRSIYENKYPDLNFDNKEDILKAADQELISR